MAHNTLVRASLAAWSIDAAVTAAEFWAIDQAQYKSINGDDGGTWAPTTPITLGGAGVEVTGVFIATECQGIDLTAGEINLFSGTRIQVLGGATLELATGSLLDVKSGSDVAVKTGAEVEFQSGSLLDINAGATIDLFGELDVESGAALEIKSGGVLVANVGSSAVLGGTTSFSGLVSYITANGRQQRRYSAPTKNTNPVIGVDTADYIQYLSDDNANHTITLKNGTGTLPVAGEEITITRRIIGTGTLDIGDEALGTILSFPSGVKGSARFVYSGTQWRVFGADDPAWMTGLA